jgi:hypothetical protein
MDSSIVNSSYSYDQTLVSLETLHCLCHPVSTLFCDKSCKYLNMTHLCEDCFTNQTLTFFSFSYIVQMKFKPTYMQGGLWMKLDESCEYWIDMAIRLSIIKIFI